MKRIFAVLSVVVLVFALCACQAKIVTAEAEGYEPKVIATEGNKFWEQTSDDEIIAPNGRVFKLPDYGWTMRYHEGRCLVLLGEGRELWLCDQDEGFFNLSGDQKVINYTVAHENLYWFNLEQEVWTLNWIEDTKAELFCEDAIAVSPHIDEAQGAVVTPERANWQSGYGLPIYSPYGK